MLDFSLGEIAVIAVVALVLIGPEDFPKALRHIIKFWRQVQGITHEVRKSVDELVNETGLKDTHHEINTIVDMYGNPQRTYDISEFLEKTRDEPRILTEQDIYSEKESGIPAHGNDNKL